VAWLAEHDRGVSTVVMHAVVSVDGFIADPGRRRRSAAGEVGGQALALGLVDEVAMDVVPVVFGSGKRYFGSVDAQHLARFRLLRPSRLGTATTAGENWALPLPRREPGAAAHIL